jgi:hypothetical protein
MKLLRVHWLPNRYQRPLVAGSILVKDIDEAKAKLANDLPHISLWTWDEATEGWKLEHGEDPET